MLNKVEKRMDKWERLNKLPKNIVEQCIKLVQDLAKEREKGDVEDPFSILAQFDAKDLAMLAASTDGDITEAYIQVKSDTDKADALLNLKQHLIEDPINVSGSLGDILHYTVKANGEKLEKIKADRSHVWFKLPYEVTVTHANESVIVEGEFETLMEKRTPKNMKALANQMKGYVHGTAIRWLEEGFKRIDLTTGPGKEWRNIHLKIIRLLRDHPVGVQFKQDTEKLEYFDHAFDKFDAEMLPFVTECMGWHSEFSYTIEDENSIAFVFSDNVFYVFTKTDGVYYENNRHGLGSPLYTRLDLARKLGN